MTADQVLVTVGASLLSGIIGVIISTVFYVRHDRKRMKLETLKRLIGNRYDLKGDEFSRALNEVFVVFRGSKRVMNVLADYHRAITSRQHIEDQFVRLLKTMCDDVGLNFKEFNDSFFLQPFNTRPSSTA